MPEELASPEQQMARLTILTRLKTGVEQTIEHYRDFSRDELTSGQFAVLVLAAISESGVSFYLDPED